MEGTTPFCDLSVNSRQEHTSTPIDTPFSPPLQIRFASGLEEALEVRLADGERSHVGRRDRVLDQDAVLASGRPGECR